MRAWIAVFVALAAGCGSDFPAEQAGGRIRGAVTYRGDAHADIPRAAVGVYAFTVFTMDPAEGILPSAFHLYEPEFGQAGLAYELAHLDPGDYDVIAQLIDLDLPPGQPAAAGAYPNLLQAGNAPVAVTAETPTVGIDIELIDMGGF
jgi:hypothetical protein